MDIAVTGASGFVGGYIARDLDRAGHTVFSYGRRKAASLSEPLPNYQVWDIVGSRIRAPKVDAVINCAALVGDWGTDQSYARVNVEGTRAVLESFSDSGRFVHMSTTSVYSDYACGRNIGENSATGDCRWSAYGRTKHAAELIVRMSRPDAIILRPHVIYGPGDTTLLPRLLSARRFGWIAVPGNGRNELSVTYIGNLALAVQRTLTADASGVFNIADSAQVAVDDLIKTILDRLGIRARIAYLPRPIAWWLASAFEAAWRDKEGPRGPMLTRYVVSQLSDEHTLDIARASRVLGYEPRWTFRDAPLETPAV